MNIEGFFGGKTLANERIRIIIVQSNVRSAGVVEAWLVPSKLSNVLSC